MEIQKGNKTLFGYPALVDRGDFCDLEVFDDLEEARKQHGLGLRRLFALGNKDTLKALFKQLPGIRELGLLFINVGSVDGLIEQILNLALERAYMIGPLPVNTEQFAERLQAGKQAQIGPHCPRNFSSRLECIASSCGFTEKDR